MQFKVGGPIFLAHFLLSKIMSGLIVHLNADVEAVVEILGQCVLAADVEVEGLAVEAAVVGVSPGGAGRGTGLAGTRPRTAILASAAKEAKQGETFHYIFPLFISFFTD